MALQNVSVIQGNLSQNLRNVSVLRSGTVVTGRVLASNSNGTYTLSLAGQIVEVKSEAKLSVGQTFKAKVSIENNHVALSLVQDSKDSSEMVQQFKFSGQNLSPQLQNFLSSLGFEPNAESFKILQFMQQLGMKIDVESAKRALAKQRPFEKESSQKSQLALLLDEKGIDSGEETVNAVLGHGKQNQEENRHGKNQQNHEELQQKHPEGLISGKNKITASEIKKFFESVDSASVSNEPGILSAFNTILSAGDKMPPLRHWLIFPFEWDFNAYHGNIRLLFDPELKKLEKAVIDLKNPEKKYIFVLYYKNNEVGSIKFSSDSSSIAAGGSSTKFLRSLLPERIKIEAVDFDSLTGFCCDDEQISVLNGSV